MTPGDLDFLEQAQKLAIANGVYDTELLTTDEIAGYAGITDFVNYPRKGEFYLLDKKLPYAPRHIVAPIPNELSRGRLLTPTAEGNLLMGPTAENITDKEDTSTSSQGLREILDEVRLMIPGINPADSATQFAGLRPKRMPDEMSIRTVDTGTGGRKKLTKALPVVTISTTCGTGTEVDQYCVITNEETGEKLDFTSEAIFPAVSFIDPELMMTLPRSQTIYQGFDALFHNAECYVTNGHRNRMLDLYAAEGVREVAENLLTVISDPNDIKARTHLAFAADILGGYAMALDTVTSHHILGQTLGGLYPAFPHGASLITVAEAYYSKVCPLLPGEFDELGEIMGEKRDPEKPGYAYVKALTRMLDAAGARSLRMSEWGVKKEDFKKIVDMTVHQVGIELDRYTLTDEDFMEILEKSYQ